MAIYDSTPNQALNLYPADMQGTRLIKECLTYSRAIGGEHPDCLKSTRGAKSQRCRNCGGCPSSLGYIIIQVCSDALCADLCPTEAERHPGHGFEKAYQEARGTTSTSQRFPNAAYQITSAFPSTPPSATIIQPRALHLRAPENQPDSLFLLETIHHHWFDEWTRLRHHAIRRLCKAN